MRTLVLALAITSVFFGIAVADPAAFHPGTGVPNGGQGGSGREVIWSEAPDLNGLIGTSEIIAFLGLQSEIANDFVPADQVGRATWWGGFYGNAQPCVPGIPTPGFNLRFYENAACAPGTLIADLSITTFQEDFVFCQAGYYPVYRWSAVVTVGLVPGNTYWFGAQMKDHAFPPQAGRLASMGVVGCESMFKSAFFGFPSWTPASDVFGVSYDASQEFETVSLPEACCFADGHCEYVTADLCQQEGGTPQGPGTTCDPNMCPPPIEACCFADGHCEDLVNTDCVAQGGVPEGSGTTCAIFQCEPIPEACCFPDGSCADLTHDQCIEHGGTPQGAFTHCETTQCQQPLTGACCIGPDCVVTTEADCVARGGTYHGDGSECTQDLCNPSPTHPSTWGRIKGLYR